MKSSKKLTKTEVDKLPPPESGQKIYFDSELKGFGVRVTANGAKTYILEKRVKDKSGKASTRRCTIGPTNVLSNEQARLEARKHLLDIVQGKDPKVVQAEREIKALTLEQVFENYKVSRQLRPRTVGNYNYTLNKCLSDLKDVPIIGITREVVEKRLHQIANANGPKGQGKVMAGECYKLLRVLVRFAQEQYEIDGKPILEVTPLRNLSRGRPWNENKRRQSVIEKHQLPAWFKAVLQLQSKNTKDYLLLTILTGLRRQEGLMLKWADVDLQGKYIKIDATRTKNHQEHRLPLSDYLLTLLKERLQANQLESPYVFPGRDKMKPLQEPKRAIHKVIEQSGVKFMCHDLRRVFLTSAEAIGTPAYALKKLANHSTKNDVTSGYIVMDTERLREPMQRITDYILGQAGISRGQHQAHGDASLALKDSETDSK
jgi:integrase